MAPMLYPELQYRVVEILVEEYVMGSRWSPGRINLRWTLFALRRTSKFLARMPIIKMALFRNLTVEASVPNLELLQANWNVLTVIMPFISNVTLLPTMYNLDLDLPAFKTLARGFAQASCREQDRSGRGVLSYDGTRWNGGRLPTTESEVEEIFQLYRERAKGDNQLLQSRELEVCWISLFGKLQRPLSLQIPAFIYNHPLTERPDLSDNISYGTEIIRGSSSANYKHFLDTAVRAFAAAETTFEAVDIDCEMAMLLSEGDLDAWTQLRLSNLTQLLFRSAGHWDCYRGSDDRNRAIESAIHLFLAKRPLGLLSFELDRTVDAPQVVCPSFRLFGLRDLEKIHLGGIEIDVPSFAKDISELRALEDIRLEECCASLGPRSWRPMFEAVHFHAKPMKLEIYNCWHTGDNEWSIDFPTLNPATFDSDLPDFRSEHGSDKALYRYLANCGPWTAELQAEYA